MPYRIDVANPRADALDALVALGALDVDTVAGGLAAIMPDTVSPDAIARALRGRDVVVSPAVGRDDGSVWVLSPGRRRIGSLVIASASLAGAEGALRLIDGPAFGTGLHLTTALCVEALGQLLDAEIAERVLDVGTGSGILALAALHRGVRSAVGLDIDSDALHAAAANAQLNGLDRRLRLVCGGPDCLRGVWPLVAANIRAAEIMAMARTLVQRVASRGSLVLSGIPCAASPDVVRTYQRLGMTHVTSYTRGTWTGLVLRPSW